MQEKPLQTGVGRISRWYESSDIPRMHHSLTALIAFQCLINALRKHKDSSIPDVLNQTFHDVDTSLSKLSEESNGKEHSGCTAVTAFLRLEDENGRQSFLPPDFEALAPSISSVNNDASSADGEPSKKSTPSKLIHAIKSLGGASSHSAPSGNTDDAHQAQTAPDNIFVPTGTVRRVLYCANAGDARGVLCRSGKAIRLTYDHKGSDKQEAKRIMDAGGFVMSGRVNGVLAVTRSLGDSSMKEFVVGSPYTTETLLNEEDEFLILACDGVRVLMPSCGSFAHF